MTGPGGSSTNRDKRRQSRQQHLQQRQLERQRERARKLRQQRFQRISIFAGGILIFAFVTFLIVHAALGSSSSLPSARGTYTTPANGETRDGLQCTAGEGQVLHYHSYLAIYANGQQIQVTPGAGIVDNTCLYPLHVHPGDNNVIHIESPDQQSYMLGEFFDIWGHPISKTQVMSYKVDATHKLVYVVVDANGHQSTYTGDPWSITLAPHETIYILYNSPNVHPQPFTNWLPGE